MKANGGGLSMLGESIDTIRLRLLALRPSPEEESALQAREEANRRHVESCRRREALNRLAKQLGSRYAPDRVDLANYAIYDPRQNAVLARVRAIGDKLGEFIKAGSNLALFGTVGTGKDYLLAHLLYRAADLGLTCHFANGLELFSRFRMTMDERAHENEVAIIDEFVRPAVVALSDPLPPSGENSNWRRETLYRLIDRRDRANKSTWMTANIVSPLAADQHFGESVWDRLQQHEVMFCDWTSYRERKPNGRP